MLGRMKIIKVSWRWSWLAAGLLVGLLATGVSARMALGPTPPPLPLLDPDHCPRVVDPKLANGEAPVSFFLSPPDTTFRVTVLVTQGAAPQPLRFVRLLYHGDMTGSVAPISLSWDGRDFRGRYVSPGDYDVRITAESSGTETLVYPVSIVRLGITEIEAQPDLGQDEWQMVYFRKPGTYGFYATPATGEYVNRAGDGEISDLDLDDGDPRPPVPLHTTTDEPVMDGSVYETDAHNYPLCYLMGASPRFLVTMGSSATSSGGTVASPGYPVPGFELRGLAEDGAGTWTSQADDIVPGGQYTYTGPSLPTEATRVDRVVRWTWQYRATGETEWWEIPGELVTGHRFYTNVGAPFWAAGASGTQYAGPWVEVSEYLHTFSEALAIDTYDEADVTEALVKGFFGQNGPLSTAIEDIVYDTYAMGGDGGANHYYIWGGNRTRLTRLLNNHALGRYVNCSDVASLSSVMLGMLGVQDVQMVYLGEMWLRAIWGIGCPDYTLDLWAGHASHGFGYHHIVTRDGADHVSDACMWVDEDGSPDTLPGVPGFNCDRPWDGAWGYNALSSSNNVSKNLDPLPRIQ